MGECVQSVRFNAFPRFLRRETRRAVSSARIFHRERGGGLAQDACTLRIYARVVAKCAVCGRSQIATMANCNFLVRAQLDDRLSRAFLALARRARTFSSCLFVRSVDADTLAGMMDTWKVVDSLLRSDFPLWRFSLVCVKTIPSDLDKKKSLYTRNVK